MGAAELGKYKATQRKIAQWLVDPLTTHSSGQARSQGRVGVREWLLNSHSHGLGPAVSIHSSQIIGISGAALIYSYSLFHYYHCCLVL